MTTTAEPSLYTGWARWRAERDLALREPYGPLSPTGLHWLGEDVVDLDGLPGLWSACGRGARVTASADSGLRVDDQPLDGTTRVSVTEGGASGVVTAGRLRLEVIQRAGRYAVRPRDPRAAALSRFTGVPGHEFDPAWVLPASFQRYPVVREIEVGSAAEGIVHLLTLVGELHFDLHGVPVSLAATATHDGSLQVLFSDGADRLRWRSLTVAGPQAGPVELDFNRAINPPAAFSPFGTCPRPPAGNHVDAAVEAGERPPN